VERPLRHLGCALATVAALAGPRSAAAHAFAPAVIVIEPASPATYAVRWQDGVDAAAENDLTLQLPTHCRPQRVGAGGGIVDCGGRGLAGYEVAVSGAGLTRQDVFLRVVQSGNEASATLHRNAPRWRIPQSLGGDRRTTLVEYTRLGIEHILLGADHLLFVLCLLLLLIERWRTLVATLTAFTLAHSLTLALTLLGYLRVPPQPVEALIAASIVLVAYELVRLPPGSAGILPTATESLKTLHPGSAGILPAATENLTTHRPWLIAFAFGLLHGLGFAGALRAIGVPKTQLPLALLGFNVGVELGQLAFVSVVFLPVFWWSRRVNRTPRLRALPAYAIGIVAVAWVIERIAAF
jgi:hypothetical protein